MEDGHSKVFTCGEKGKQSPEERQEGDTSACARHVFANNKALCVHSEKAKRSKEWNRAGQEKNLTSSCCCCCCCCCVVGCMIFEMIVGIPLLEYSCDSSHNMEITPSHDDDDEEVGQPTSKKLLHNLRGDYVGRNNAALKIRINVATYKYRIYVLSVFSS